MEKQGRRFNQTAYRASSAPHRSAGSQAVGRSLPMLLLLASLSCPRTSLAQIDPSGIPHPYAAAAVPILSPQVLTSATATSSSASVIPAPGLPDAPGPAPESSSAAPTNDTTGPEAALASASAPEHRPIPLRDCPYDHTHARECRVHWGQLLISSSLFLTFQNAGNAYTGYDYRYQTTHGKWLDRYVDSVTGYKFSVWSDGNPWLDDYLAHPMMGAITSFLWVQNDPHGMTLDVSNTRAYWHSRLRAFAFAAAYSTEWKLGPAGESGVGHAGDHVAFDNNRLRVETGFVSLVTTPVGGALWGMGEDLLDRHLITRLEDRSRNPFALFAYQFLSPARGAANILRFRPPWYRDTRVVKATGFWSDPGPGTSGLTRDRPLEAATASPRSSEALPASEPTPGAAAVGLSSGRARIQPCRKELSQSAASAAAVRSASLRDTSTVACPTEAATPTASSLTSASSSLPAPPSSAAITPARTAIPDLRPGGTHELGAWWGLSLKSGTLFGYRTDTKYMPIDVRYSYRFVDRPRWALRYSPEITALAMLDEVNWAPVDALTRRRRTYGSGLSPVGFQAVFAPAHRVQPFAGLNGGFLYFADRVLSPQGSQWMYTTDFGGGITIFRKANQALTLGYRYQHLSNANISVHNPGTDANTFYVGVSRFRTRSHARTLPGG